MTYKVQIVDPCGPVGTDGAKFRRIGGGMDVHFGNARTEFEDCFFDDSSASDAIDVQEVVRRDDSLFGGETAERESD